MVHIWIVFAVVRRKTSCLVLIYILNWTPTSNMDINLSYDARKSFVMIHKCWSHAEILWIRVSIIHAKEKTKRRANLPLVFFGSTEEGKSQKLKKAIIVGKYITAILLFFSVPFLTLYKGRKKFNDTWMYHTSTDNDLSERKL